ncbi:MAG: hypothetical protein V2A34_02515 [Lentisphaerota bacterium]
MIAAFKGISMMSRMIEWRTWSDYSHVGWLRGDMSIIEAWSKGVTHTRRFDDDHMQGTIIELFKVRLTEGEESGLEEFLLSQKGKAYDWAGILAFASRLEIQSQDKWFCSELLFAGFDKIKKPLLARIPAWKVPPGLLLNSPLLEENGTLVCGQNERTQHEIDYAGDVGSARCF